MLEKILLLESGVIRGLLVSFVGLVGSLASLFGVDEALFGTKAGPIVDGIVALLAAGGLFYAAWARATKPNPPITEGAVEKTAERLASEGKSGGFARPAFLLALSAACVLAAVVVSGCTGTRAAYKAADGDVGQLAFVVTEHYAAIVEQAANLSRSPGLPAGALQRMQAADRLARPAIEALRPAAAAWEASRSETDRALLAQKVNEAVVKLADLVRAVKAARGGV